MLSKDIEKILKNLGFKEKGKNKSFYLTFKNSERKNVTIRISNHKKHRNTRYILINYVCKNDYDVLKLLKKGKLNYENYR